MTPGLRPRPTAPELFASCGVSRPVFQYLESYRQLRGAGHNLSSLLDEFSIASSHVIIIDELGGGGLGVGLTVHVTLNAASHGV